MFAILSESLGSISSLQHFHKTVETAVLEEYKKGKKQFYLGAMAELYFCMLSHEEEFANDERFHELKEVLEKEIENVSVNAEGNSLLVKYRLKDENRLKQEGVEVDFKKASAAFQKYREMPIIHGNNTLVMLITKFEEFISLVLSDIFVRFPGKYLDNKQIAFSEIKNCNADEVQRKIVLREIDAIMRESYLEWFSVFEKHKMKFESCDKELRFLREMYYRRNIIVHNSGVVNDIYLKGIPDSKAKLGERLYVTSPYLATAFEAIKIIIFTIMIEAAKLLAKEDRTNYVDDVFGLVYDELQNEEYHICSKVFPQLVNNDSADSQIKTMSKVNYWISKIELGKRDQVLQEIKDFDVSALNDSFALAKETLLENYDTAFRIINYLYPKDISAMEIENWPLFIHLRKTTQYAEFIAAHAQDFGMSSMEVKPTTCCEENEEKEQSKGDHHD